MAKKQKPIYCWDTTTLLAWLKNEDSAPLADIALVVQEIDSGDATLVIPTTVYTELLEAALSTEQQAVLDAFLKRSNVISADLTVAIARRAADIRHRGHCETPKRKVRTPDSQMAATALALSAAALHTLDSDLLRLNNHPTAECLRITKPIPLSGQHGLV